MKKPHLEFSLYPDTYPIEIHICYSSYSDKVEKYFKKKTGEPTLERTGAFDSTACTSRFKHHILIEIKPDQIREPHLLASLIAHEAVHATWMIEKAIGNLFHEEAQEPQCYMVQYIVHHATRNIWTYIKKRHGKDYYKKKKK